MVAGWPGDFGRIKNPQELGFPLFNHCGLIISENATIALFVVIGVRSTADQYFADLTDLTPSTNNADNNVSLGSRVNDDPAFLIG
jgi:hypothetical protein